MAVNSRNTGRWTVALSLAASLLFANLPLAFAGAGDAGDFGSANTNSLNTSSNINSGTFYNTAGSQTTFRNTNGLTIGSGVTVRGLEVDGAGNLTNNGGHMHFDAGKGMMRIENGGTLDASALMSGGKYVGDGGTITINAGALVQNGNVFASGLNGGVIGFNVGSITVGPNARIEALSANGLPGGININSKGTVDIKNGAIVDASGNYLGGYNANVIQIKGNVVNLEGIVQANGLGTAGARPTIGIYGSEIKIASSGKISADGLTGESGATANNGGQVILQAQKSFSNEGLVSANGGNGFVGDNPGHGGEGGSVQALSNGNWSNSGVISANGGHGGTNPNVVVGPVVNGVQESIGQNGGNGGNAGSVIVAFEKNISNSGQIQVIGGNGGEGQLALAEAQGAHQIATGGNGGDAGTGGLVRFYGIPDQNVLNNVNVSGGSGGHGGGATIASDCGCATPGSNGKCGGPGHIEMIPKQPPCSGGGTCTPPKTPPNSPPNVLYPREYTSLGDTLPGRTGSVLNYNRSIFLARAPLPIIQKKAPPPVVVPPPAKVMVVKPKPKPPQKKVPVRGYW